MNKGLNYSIQAMEAGIKMHEQMNNFICKLKTAGVLHMVDFTSDVFIVKGANAKEAIKIHEIFEESFSSDIIRRNK